MACVASIVWGWHALVVVVLLAYLTIRLCILAVLALIGLALVGLALIGLALIGLALIGLALTGLIVLTLTLGCIRRRVWGRRSTCV